MTRISRLLAAASLLGSVAIATPASAVTLFYNFTPTAASQSAFSFNIDSNPVPDDTFGNAFQEAVQNYTLNGAAVGGATSFFFYTSADGGGLSNSNFSINLYGQQLFSGLTSAPTLLTGNFTLFGSSAQTVPVGNLSVTNAMSITAAVPEPATWALMVIGFGGMGAALRRGKSKVTTKVAFA